MRTRTGRLRAGPAARLQCCVAEHSKARQRTAQCTMRARALNTPTFAPPRPCLAAEHSRRPVKRAAPAFARQVVVFILLRARPLPVSAAAQSARGPSLPARGRLPSPSLSPGRPARATPCRRCWAWRARARRAWRFARGTSARATCRSCACASCERECEGAAWRRRRRPAAAAAAAGAACARAGVPPALSRPSPPLPCLATPRLSPPRPALRCAALRPPCPCPAAR